MTAAHPAGQGSRPRWVDLRRRAEAALSAIPVAAPTSEARWIVERASGLESTELVLHEDEPATRQAVAHFEVMLRRRRNGEPLGYVLERWSFRGIDLLVDGRVLLPRPETEVVAQVAIDEAVRLGAHRGRDNPWSTAPDPFRVADLGTGSGALALALAAELPDAEVWATDVSEDALAVARANLAGTAQAATRIRLMGGSWYDALPSELAGRFDLIVSNPPYVAEKEVADLPPEVAHHEPLTALVSGPTGLEGIEAVVRGATAWLTAHGVVVCELAPHQSDDATTLARDAGFTSVRVELDLAGRRRVLVGRRGQTD